MGTPSVIKFKGTKPNWGSGFQAGEGAALIGRAKLGEGVKIGSWSALRGDGHFIDIGDNCIFMDRSTVHIADGVFPTKMGRNIMSAGMLSFMLVLLGTIVSLEMPL